MNEIKNPTCSQLKMNYLSIYCNGSNVSWTDYSRTDYLIFRSFRIPTPYQISKGLDADNHKAGGFGYLDIRVKYTKLFITTIYIFIFFF